MHQLDAPNPSVNDKWFYGTSRFRLCRYNAPTSRTDAEIFVGDEAEPQKIEIFAFIQLLTVNTNKIFHHLCSDPMVYPLLFLNGECGWNSNLEHAEESNLQNVLGCYRCCLQVCYSVRNADM
ncbi:hypothetical protein AVEN_223030-1 [Araneus ventricosus]|uniref:Uncharacterized protein n=1 Tax=Araneus ventricosus TaxID=182803 RepID=A0A4Y2UUK2_ARAVE|nr:hypothetical protein AVEN_223030-1 [Araneus ventricosus]